MTATYMPLYEFIAKTTILTFATRAELELMCCYLRRLEKTVTMLRIINKSPTIEAVVL